MGEYITGKNPIVYNVTNDKGLIIFTGTMKQIAARFNTDDRLMYKYYYEGKKFLNTYTIAPATSEFDTDMSPLQLKEHLWTEKGRRNYEYKKGYPNRYRDASCRRFTPL